MVYIFSFFFILCFAATNESHVFRVGVQVVFMAVQEILNPYFFPGSF